MQRQSKCSERANVWPKREHPKAAASQGTTDLNVYVLKFDPATPLSWLIIYWSSPGVTTIVSHFVFILKLEEHYSPYYALQVADNFKLFFLHFSKKCLESDMTIHWILMRWTTLQPFLIMLGHIW